MTLELMISICRDYSALGELKLSLGIGLKIYVTAELSISNNKGVPRWLINGLMASGAAPLLGHITKKLDKRLPNKKPS
jgi:hypothetical protein